MKHSSSFDDDGRRDGPGPSRPSHYARHDSRLLPSLSEVGLFSLALAPSPEALTGVLQAVPEIRRTNPALDNLIDFPRELDDSPRGPGSMQPDRYPAARSLGPSPRMASSAGPSPAVEASGSIHSSSSRHPRYGDYEVRTQVQMPILPGRPNRHSDSSLSSEYSERRTSVATSITYGGTRRGSPNLPEYSRRRSPEPHGLTNGHTSGPHRRALPLTNASYELRAPPLHERLHPSIETYSPSSQRYHHPPCDNPRNLGYDIVNPHHLPYEDPRRVETAFFRENGQRHHYPINFESVEGEQKHKRRRGNLPKAVTDTLRHWFHDHVAHPYPTEEEKQMLMDRTGLTISQVRSKLE